jgi:hypothetical protein
MMRRQRPLVLVVMLLSPRLLCVAAPSFGERLIDGRRVASGGQEDRPHGGEKAAA